MRITGPRLAHRAALPALIVTTLSMSSQAVTAAVPSRAAGTATAGFLNRPDPCGSNRYGCYDPYGPCDNYQPGCAGPDDQGYKPYDYDQHTQDYGNGYDN